MIELAEVHKSFGRQHVLRGVTLTIPPGKITVIIGPSGTGKSVTLRHMIGLTQPDRGRVLVDGINVATLDRRGLTQFRRRFGMVFQHAALFDSMTVYENLAFPLREDGGHTEAAIRTRVRERLQAVGLSGIEEKMPSELSGGMRKRVGIARALVLQPAILLYDEPTTGLDPLMTDAIDKLIMAMQHERPITSVVISHDVESTFRIADQIAMLSGGRIVEAGAPETFRRSGHPIVRRFLEGRSEGTPGDPAIDETMR
ncbi:MAG: ABC transporter ATP-binding protein [Deltaproteobacteria bacterium]|nr:ABC transporter ATP-binding protein [Deltaproteobacteria bacterium]